MEEGATVQNHQCYHRDGTKWGLTHDNGYVKMGRWAETGVEGQLRFHCHLWQDMDKLSQGEGHMHHMVTLETIG